MQVPQTPLMFTMKSRHRVLAAISWDARADKATLMDKLKGTNQQHDLDLSCFVFNSSGEYIDYVSAMAQDSMDQTGCIYHSGDDATGAGDGDDETISCELAGLPMDTAQLVFVTEIRSDHVFDQVDDPYFRLADGMSNENLFELHMATHEGKDKKACVIGKIFRGRSPTGWCQQLIEDYPNLDDVTDWGSYLTRFL